MVLDGMSDIRKASGMFSFEAKAKLSFFAGITGKILPSTWMLVFFSRSCTRDFWLYSFVLFQLGPLP